VRALSDLNWKYGKYFSKILFKTKHDPFRFEEASASMTFFVTHLRICWWANWGKKKTRGMAKVMISKRKKTVDLFFFNSFLKIFCFFFLLVFFYVVPLFFFSIYSTVDLFWLPTPWDITCWFVLIGYI
jgi:hypothetical protein